MKNKKIKMYVTKENLNEYEKEHNRVSYRRLIDRISNSIYLFNKAPQLADYDFDYIIGNDYDEENDTYTEIYQYYLIDINRDEDFFKELEQKGLNDLIIAYSEKLENYILLVDHFGTSWDYVLTDIEPTENLKEADL